MTIQRAELRSDGTVAYVATWALACGDSASTPPGSVQLVGVDVTTDVATLGALASGDWLTCIELDAARCGAELEERCPVHGKGAAPPVALVVAPSKLVAGKASPVYEGCICADCQGHPNWAPVVDVADVAEGAVVALP